MANAIAWSTVIADTDLVAAPTLLTDPNVFDASLKSDIALSADVTGGTDPTVTVTVYYWDALVGAFFPSGDVFILTPASANLALANPNGLILGFTAVGGGTAPPASFNLNIGDRD